MLGGHTDNYYYQLASWVRRFKGVREQPCATGPSSIRIDGEFKDWSGVRPEFRDRIGDVAHRDHPGYGELVYRNDTGRNDLVILKAAYDRRNLYFYAQTRQAITTPEGEHWMLLLLDTDQDASTGWLGYDLVVNHEVSGEHETVVHRWESGSWHQAGKGKLAVNGNAMELSFPRTLLFSSRRPGSLRSIFIGRITSKRSETSRNWESMATVRQTAGRTIVSN